MTPKRVSGLNEGAWAMGGCALEVAIRLYSPPIGGPRLGCGATSGAPAAVVVPNTVCEAHGATGLLMC
jgi:hypothetical protein